MSNEQFDVEPASSVQEKGADVELVSLSGIVARLGAPGAVRSMIQVVLPAALRFGVGTALSNA